VPNFAYFFSDRVMNHRRPPSVHPACK
jgi:hypothetical protein